RSATAASVVDPVSSAAATIASLARNPERGGVPAREKRGTRISAAIAGLDRYSPPSEARSLVCRCRRKSPLTRKSVVMTRMWWSREKKEARSARGGQRAEERRVGEA